MFKLNPIFVGVLCSAFSLQVVAETIKTPNGFIVRKDVKHDISLPLRYLQADTNILARHYAPIKKILAEESAPNPLVSNSLVSLKGFQGMGVGLGSYTPTQVSSNSNGTVGPDKYMQWVDYDLAIFDKATGSLAAGFPKPGPSVWAGFGNLCETHSTGLMTMKYDQLAHRWLLTQYATLDLQTGPYYHCLAVSTSDDPTGSYYRYAFQLDSYSNFARSALWPDAYYMSLFMLGRNSSGPLACAFERDKMLVGETAAIQCKQIPVQESDQLVPADLEGESLPLPGNPEYFIGLNPPAGLTLYKFHVDFASPLNSSLLKIEIPVNAFTRACTPTGGLACAVQPNTQNRLNVLSDSLRRLIYRQFDQYGSLVTSHIIEGAQPRYVPAIRWYEMRVPKNTTTYNPVIYQQGTIGPDSKNRFLANITLDKQGGIAVAYTVSSRLIYPSIEMASRVATDPLNTMTIQPLLTGHGSQINGINNWGPISKIAIDPADNCTFWYTSQYLKTTGSLNWSTFIIHFKLPGCV